MSSRMSFDTSTLLSASAALALFLSAFKSPRYNFPLFLFGIVADALQSTNHPLRLFAGFLALSGVLDVLWFIWHGHRQGWFTFLLSLAALILKAPTFYATIGSLRARGDNFYASIPSVEISSRGVHLSSSEPIWTMPGDLEQGETIPGGYNVPAASNGTSSAGGAHQASRPTGGQQQGAKAGPGAYSAI